MLLDMNGLLHDRKPTLKLNEKENGNGSCLLVVLFPFCGSASKFNLPFWPHAELHDPAF